MGPFYVIEISTYGTILAGVDFCPEVGRAIAKAPEDVPVTSLRSQTRRDDLEVAFLMKTAQWTA